MRILIATPLYPPDIAEPAPYVKELAQRLLFKHHITILTYNYIPEIIPGVHIISIPKYAILPIRLIRYTYKFWSEARKVDYVYIQNGPSTELPLIFISFFIKARCILRLGDEASLTHALKNIYRKTLLRLALHRADFVITHCNSSPCTTKLKEMISGITSYDIPRPLPRPEILPFVPYPTLAFELHNRTWQEHIHDIQNLLENYEHST